MTLPCRLCGGQTHLLYHPTIKATYHACERCEVILKDPADFISSEAELCIYNTHQNSIEDPRYVAYFQQFINEAVLPYANGGTMGLDFGSGPSPVLAQLLERDYGYEMDIYDLYYAPEKVYEGKQYDLITSTEVVEHLSHPLDYFQLFQKRLTPGGILAVMTQFHRNDTTHFMNWHYVRDRSHISFYTPTTMRYLAEQSDLQVVYTNDERYITFTSKGVR